MNARGETEGVLNYVSTNQEHMHVDVKMATNWPKIERCARVKILIVYEDFSK